MEGRLDLRLFAPEVVVEPGDNLRAPYARVEILKGCYRLELSRPGLGDVLIRQKEGFSAPWVRIEAPNLRGEAERFRSDFALERIEAENPRFEFPAGELRTLPSGRRKRMKRMAWVLLGMALVFAASEVRVIRVEGGRLSGDLRYGPWVFEGRCGGG